MERPVIAEVCCRHRIFIDSVSNAEAAALGTDLITLNLFDMNKHFVCGYIKKILILQSKLVVCNIKRFS